MTNKIYLGDGVYVSYDGYHIVLTTSTGGEPDNTIYLDHYVSTQLVEYMKRLGIIEVRNDN